MANKVIGFHLIDEPNGYLSNWYPSLFVLDGVQYNCAEQYMMYQKALTFGDHKTAEQILQTSDPGAIKALGKAVSPFNDTIWSGIRQVVVYEALLAKFSQNGELGAQLLATGDAILAECARSDRIWGIGLGMDDEDRHDINKWRGRNLLGFALMAVRSKLSEA